MADQDQEAAAREEAASKASRELPAEERRQLRTESTADYLSRTATVPKATRSRSVAANPAQAALLAAVGPAKSSASSNRYDPTNYGHRRMAESADRFIRHSNRAVMGARGALEEAEKARGDYWEAHRETGHVEGLEGPCSGRGCPAPHAPEAKFCAGGSCTGKRMGRSKASAAPEASSLPSTTREKAGPEAPGRFGSDAGFYKVVKGR